MPSTRPRCNCSGGILISRRGNPRLTSKFTCGAGIPSSFGIAASATIAQVGRQKAVIFAAPDETSDSHLGDGYIFALNANTGTRIWKSDVVARVTGVTAEAFGELHEKTGYSSPIVANGRVYVGVHDHCDNPIQKGRVVAVDLKTGKLVPSFEFCGAGFCNDDQRGGGVWSSIAVWENDLFVTTGNTNLNPGKPQEGLPPYPNYGLGLLRLDGTTGDVKWVFQPVPYSMDQDPDWASGATVMDTTCGPMVLSTQKDGWTYALGAAGASVRWGFPPRSHIYFQPDDGTFHGDTQYKRPGAAWGDVFVTTTAGHQASTTRIREGYRRLYAFDVCSTREFRILSGSTLDPVRWILDVPDKYISRKCASAKHYPFTPWREGQIRNCLGPPTVTGGVFFVGTDAGWLLAIADPSLYGVTSTLRCSNPDFNLDLCRRFGYPIVASPEILAAVKLDDSAILTEPVLVDGKVYVANDGGRIYKLEPLSFWVVWSR